MAEIVNTYLVKNPFELIPMDRDEFYCDQMEVFKKTGEPTRAVEVVNIFIFNTKGELIIQKRSSSKAHNPNLLDKSIGGHVVNGDELDYTVMVETVQELQTPSIVLKNDNDFIKAYAVLSNYLDTIALTKHLATVLLSPIKIINNEEIRISNKMSIYIGVYDGRIRPVDGEAKGILFYTLPDLEQEMKEYPKMFTDDLHVLINDYRDELYKFVEQIKVNK